MNNQEVEILYYYDGPQLVAFDTKRGTKIVAIAFNAEDEYDFFGAEMTKGQYDRYINGDGFLRDLFELPDMKKWYYVNIDTHPRKMKRVNKITAEIKRKCFPSAGFRHTP
jgi:hypothetical protein